MRTWCIRGQGRAGTPLVCLHGIGSNASAFAGVFAAFGDERPVLAWNAPGYGGSAALDELWPAGEDYARALKALIGHLALRRPFVLVGQSLGAIMATAYARLYRQDVAVLVLASPARGYGVGRGQPLPAGVQARLDDLEALGPEAFAAKRYARLLGPDAPPEAHDSVRRAMAEVDPQGYLRAVHLLAASDLLPEVAGLTQPCVVVWGAQDVVTPPEACREVAEAARATHSIEVPGGGHAFITERPAAFNRILRPLLEAADGTS